MKRMVFFYSWLACLVWGGEVEEFVVAAEEKHGEFGGKAARFLMEGMPKSDRENLTKDFLATNLDLALKWAFQRKSSMFVDQWGCIT